jgi:hypothetical protein
MSDSKNTRGVLPNFGPRPKRIEGAEISSDALSVWPEWVSELVPPGSKWERIYWPDDSITIRLVNHRGLVLACCNSEPTTPKVIPAPEWAKKQMDKRRSQEPPDLERVRQQMQARAEHRRKADRNPPGQ